MKGKFKLYAALFGLWQLVAIVLGVWWGSLLLKQSSRIAELEMQTGASLNDVEASHSKMKRMLVSESSVFFILLFGSAGILGFLTFRDYKRSRSIEAFFASFTHELKTPLTSIRLQAETIYETGSDLKLKKNVERLLEDTLRLESQVEKTLELARLEGGGPVYTQPISLKHFLSRIERNWKETYPESFEIEVLCDDNFHVTVDQNALQIILKNLLENAIRHARVEKLKIIISVALHGSEVLLKFTDNGHGFIGGTKVRNLGAIFNKGKESQGTGVGLYLVKTLMHKMHGDADFESDHGFHVTLHFKEHFKEHA